MFKEILRLFKRGGDPEIEQVVSRNLKALGFEQLNDLDLRIIGLDNRSFELERERLLDKINQREDQKNAAIFLDQRRNALLMQQQSS